MVFDDDGGRTVWTRLEPDSRDGSMDEGLRARVHDPLWMLTRQWQLGEFQGEDAGSPVDVYVDVAFDEISRYRPVGEGESDTTKPGRQYDGEPLEALVERESVLTGKRGPNARLAAQGGSTFLRLLRKHTDADPAATEFQSGYVLSESLADADEPVDEEGQRYTDFVGGRVVDGHAVFLAIDAALSGGSWTPDPTLPWESDADWDGPSGMPTPKKLSASDGGYETAAREYHEWYGNLYEEPDTDEEDAWDPTRMEYDFQIATGGPGENDTTETVLSTAGYTGGRLGWPDFSPVRPGEEKDPSIEMISKMPSDEEKEEPPSLFGDGETGGTTTHEEQYFLPTKVRFKGMPSRRYWEFEDADVDLSKISEDDVSSQALLNFALVYGNDWYSFPIDAPLGSLVRIPFMSVKDTFGIEDQVFPLSEGMNMPGSEASDPYWNAFSVRDLPNHDEPGLFVPPVFDDVTESDPVEQVTTSRDEMANLAFAIEQRFESVTGQPIDRDEYVEPDLVVDAVTPATDPAEESVTFRNPGREPLDVGKWVIANDDGDQFDIPAGTTIGPEETLTVHTGTAPKDEDSETDVYLGASKPLWAVGGDTVVMSVYGPAPGSGGKLTDDRLELRERVPLRSGGGENLPGARYALATDLFDHWFALRPERGADGASANATAKAAEYFFELALVLDAESLDAATIAELPDPEGRILRPYPESDAKTLRVRDEEVRATGTEVTRTYQKATWTDGTTYLWSGREASAGKSNVGSSALRYDVVENWTGEDGA